MNLIGLDIGTTGCRAVVFDADGAVLAAAGREYPVDFPHPNWAEQDAERVWALARESLSQAIARAGVRDVAAIGLSVQGEAITPVDAKGDAIRATILGMDTRTDAENVMLGERFGAEWLFRRTGMPVHTVNTLPKLLWLKAREPDVWRRADRFLLYEDFLTNKMTGRAVTSRCLASRTQMYDLWSDGWSDEILDAVELDPKRLASVQQSGVAVGELTRDLTEAIGLTKPPLVVSGGHDQACAALGAGLTRAGLAMVSTGTAEVVEVALPSPDSLTVNDALQRGNVSVYAHVVPGLFLAMTLNQSGGLLLRWFRDTLCASDLDAARQSGRDAYDVILAGAPAGPTSLLVLPHFAGAGTPTFDTRSKGAILGLTFGTTKAEIAKALIEGLTFELAVNLDLLADARVSVDELRAVGGGAKSDLWLRLKADIGGIPVVAPRVTEAASWGAAMLAGVAAGAFASAADAAERTVRFDRRFAPDPAGQAAYAPRYALYREVYPTLKELNHRI